VNTRLLAVFAHHLDAIVEAFAESDHVHLTSTQILAWERPVTDAGT
jgi:hypothetical protein